MNTSRTTAELREALAPRRSGSIGLVPTMGSLHGGHRALLRAARSECDTVVMSLFINPAQFGDAADLDVVFAPTATDLYPPGFQTWVEVADLGTILEGEQRPDHFRGVATICLKLFNLVAPDVAFFGQKDAQQAEVLRRMITDLNLALELRVVPTVRDATGLALSSRNARLSEADHAQALALPRALATGDPKRAREMLEAAGLDIDYVALAPFSPPVLAAAVRVGHTRLIDNVPLEA
jgi:pantoate--beta-alanine ligase